MDLDSALDQFDIVEANLLRLEKVWSELNRLIPLHPREPQDDGVVPRHLELVQAYASIINGLPPIGECVVETLPMAPDALSHGWVPSPRATGVDEIQQYDEKTRAPGREIQKYRASLIQARRELVRDHLQAAMAEIDPLLRSLTARVPKDHQRIEDENWSKLTAVLARIERLTGSMVPRRARWRDMRRHANIGQGVDLHDIAVLDWPSVRAEIEANLYSDLEPLPVTVGNVLDLVRSRPAGPVTMKLNWNAISPDLFERLLYDILKGAAGYANAQLLMHTNAPDRGRDISVERTVTDPLTGARTQRVIVQAKHWLSRPVGLSDISSTLTQMELWNPRPHVMIMATTGRFTLDAVAWVEQRDQDGAMPFVELWSEVHLEQLLAERPHLIAEYNLR